MSDKNNKSNFKKIWLPLFVFAVAVICFYKVVDKLPDVFSGIISFIGIISPFIVGVVIAFVLYKPASKLERQIKKSRKKFFVSHARGLSVATCYAALLLIIFVSLYLILPRIFSSVLSLVNNLPEYYNSLMAYIDGLAGADGKILGFDVESIKGQLSVSSILSFFDISTVTKYAEGLFKATGAVVDFFLSIVVSVYVLLGHEHLIKVCGKLFGMVLPERKKIRLYQYLVKTSKIFYSYIYSQLIDGIIVAVLCFIVFTIIGLPYALLLALLMGICNLIPYFGALIGGAGVVFVTLISTGNFVQSIIALVCVIGAQQLDANVIQPRIVADSLGLKPIYVLLAIMVGSGLFGFTGIVLSVPVVAVIRMLILDYMNNLGNRETLIVKKQEELREEK